jgi:hypothetical protein
MKNEINISSSGGVDRPAQFLQRILKFKLHDWCIEIMRRITAKLNAYQSTLMDYFGRIIKKKNLMKT